MCELNDVPQLELNKDRSSKQEVEFQFRIQNQNTS